MSPGSRYPPAREPGNGRKQHAAHISHYSELTMNQSPVTVTVQLAKALAHPTRLRILALLHHGSLPVCQITSVLHAVASTVSGHLLELRRGGLVIEQRQGRFVHYRLSDDASIAAVLDPLFTLLDGDTQIRADAVLGASIRAISPLIVCNGSPEAPGNASATRAARTTMAVGAPRS